MRQTDYYGIPFPELADEPNGAAQMEALATVVENILKNGYTIPSGNLIIGDPASVVQRFLVTTALYAGKGYEVVLGNSGTACVLLLKESGAEVARLQLNMDGQFQVNGGGVFRPVPFAMSTGVATLPASGTTASSVAIAFPVNRFTQTPSVCGNIHSGSGTVASAGGVRFHTISATGCTVMANMPTGTFTIVISVSWMAVQLTPSGTGPGPFMTSQTDEDGTRTVVVTCHTEGCENAEQAIDLPVPEESVGVTCGVCGQSIDDVQAA